MKLSHRYLPLHNKERNKQNERPYFFCIKTWGKASSMLKWTSTLIFVVVDTETKLFDEDIWQRTEARANLNHKK